MKFNVIAQVTISVHKSIEASTAEEAMEIAAGLSVPGLCWQCSTAGSDDDETWELSGELDGAAVNILVED